MEKFNKIKERGLRIAATVSSHHTGAFAAQAAYFFVLSLIPIFMLLLTMVQFTPVTKADVMEAVLPVFPSTVSPMIESIVNQVYMTSSSIIPVTILVALWSAGKGVLSVTYGLNCIYENTETRNYFYLRARACLYTFLFLVAIMLSLVLSVFGNSISVIVYEHAPFLSKVIHKVVQLRIYFTLPLLTFFWIWYISSFRTVEQQGRLHFGNSCRELSLLPAGGWLFPLSFPSIWIFLKDSLICMEVLRRLSLLCFGCMAVCILFFLEARSMRSSRDLGAEGLDKKRCCVKIDW